MLSKVVIGGLLGLYIGSTYCAYKFTQLAHSKGGKFETLNVDGDDIFLTFIPLFHLIYAFGYLFKGYKKNNLTLNNMFKVQK